MRDRFTCRYCGRVPGHTELVIDHMQSLQEGGTNDEKNLVTACTRCNYAKRFNSVRPEELPPLPPDYELHIEAVIEWLKACPDEQVSVQAVIQYLEEVYDQG